MARHGTPIVCRNQIQVQDDFKYRPADGNPADGHARSINGVVVGLPHRYEVIAPWGPLGFVYKIEAHYFGACYTHWYAEVEQGTPIPGTFSRRADAAHALLKSDSQIEQEQNMTTTTVKSTNGTELSVTIDPHYNRAEVSVELTGGRIINAITVYGPRTAFGSKQPATVNWSGIGSVPAEDAVRYADAISYAAQLAAQWPVA